jgi:hypothetical protein
VLVTFPLLQWLLLLLMLQWLQDELRYVLLHQVQVLHRQKPWLLLLLLLLLDGWSWKAMWRSRQPNLLLVLLLHGLWRFSRVPSTAPFAHGYRSTTAVVLAAVLQALR